MEGKTQTINDDIDSTIIKDKKREFKSDITENSETIENSDKVNEMRPSQGYTDNNEDSVFKKARKKSSFYFTALRGSLGSFINPSSSIPDDENSRKEDNGIFDLRATVSEFGKKNTRIIKNPKLAKVLLPSFPKLEKIETEKYKYIGYINEERKRNGFGICSYKNGDKYSGNWENDKKEGYGKYFMKSVNKTFQGEFNNNQIEGFVEYINKNGVAHQGIMRNLKFSNGEVMIIHHPLYELKGVMEFNMSINKLSGIASIQYQNGNYYEGETIETLEYGCGITYKSDDTIVRRLKKDDKKLDSYCEIDYPNGDRFFGWFENNKRQGVGISMNKEGIYTIGKYIDDYKDGGFLTCCKGEAKLDIHNLGFLSKTIEKKENIIYYLNLVYPEYKWLCKANNKLLHELINKKTEKKSGN
jgi:hypothetical protein